MLSNINNIGFIGCGKMGGAIASGILKSGNKNIIGAEATAELASAASERLGIDVLVDVAEVVKKSKIIFMALKPQYVLPVLEDVKEYIAGKVLVSVAAGVTTAKIESVVKGVPVIRVMPNTPALIGEGVFGVAKGSLATEEHLAPVVKLLSNIGECIEVKESQIDVVTALSGSGPAFFYKVINEMAKGAANLGLDYSTALKLSLRTAIGSAKMIENSEVPVETLISNVATKGGCTAVGVDFMNDFDSEKLFSELIRVTAEKAASLG